MSGSDPTPQAPPPADRPGPEDALRESEERFARFMDHLAGLAWIKDAEGRYIFVNAAAEKVFRLSKEQLLGKTDAELFSAGTAAQFQENDRRALASEAGVQTIETLEHADGILHHSLVSKFPIPGPGGQPALIGGMAIDVTDRIQAREQQQRLEQELRRRVAELAEADRHKDEFLAVLSHELRNPLAPLRNALALLKLADHDAAVRAQARGIMERQLQQLVRLTDDLLDISRITRNRLELRTERMELAGIVRSAVETSRPLIDEARHELTVVVPEEPIVVDADQTRLAQAFLNLLSNAARYTPPGGHIRLTVEPEAGAVAVRVQDDGIGIPADKLSHVFEMFMQVDRSLERSQGGLGVGLTLVKQLVELHGGNVEALSAGPGRGSEFIIRLPVIPAGTAPVPSSEQGTAAFLHRRRILVVDDNRDAVETLALVLREMGGEVRVAYDGEQALESAAAFHPEIVVLDIGMPRLNGYEAARRLRAQPWARDLALIALTGWGKHEDRCQAAAAGFDYHLTKPVDPAALGKLLAGLPLPSP